AFRDFLRMAWRSTARAHCSADNLKKDSIDWIIRIPSYPALDECFSSSSNKPSIYFLPLHNPLPPTTPFSSRTKAKGVTRTRKSRKNRFLRSQRIFPRISRPLTNSSNFFLSPTPIRTKFNLFWYFIQHWFH